MALAINYIYIHLTVQSSHQHITLSTMHKKRWHVSVISFPNYFKLCDILSFFSCIFLFSVFFFFFGLRTTRIIPIYLWCLVVVFERLTMWIGIKVLLESYSENSTWLIAMVFQFILSVIQTIIIKKLKNILGILNWLPGIKIALEKSC